MISAFSEGKMVSDDALELQPSPARRGKHCRHCKAEAVDPPLLTIDSRRLHDWFLCEACWLLLEIGFSDAHPHDDLYQYLIPLDGRLSDPEVYRYVLRGRVLLERRGRLVE